MVAASIAFRMPGATPRLSASLRPPRPAPPTSPPSWGTWPGPPARNSPRWGWPETSGLFPGGPSTPERARSRTSSVSRDPSPPSPRWHPARRAVPPGTPSLCPPPPRRSRAQDAPPNFSSYDQNGRVPAVPDILDYDGADCLRRRVRLGKACGEYGRIAGTHYPHHWPESSSSIWRGS